MSTPRTLAVILGGITLVAACGSSSTTTAGGATRTTTPATAAVSGPIEVAGTTYCAFLDVEATDTGLSVRQACVVDIDDDRFDGVNITRSLVTGDEFTAETNTGAVFTGACGSGGVCSVTGIEPRHPDFPDMDICLAGQVTNLPDRTGATSEITLTIGCDTDMEPVESVDLVLGEADGTVLCSVPGADELRAALTVRGLIDCA